MSASNPLKPPFRQKDLLGVDQFCRYCEDNGIRVARKELEELHRERLLYPAIRLRMGYDTMEIDGKKQFFGGSYIVRDGDWIDRKYTKPDIDYPADIPFFKWKERHPVGIPVENLKEIENDYELFYDKHQRLALTITRRWKEHRLPEDDPKEFDQKIRNKLAEFYRFIALYFDAEQMWDEYCQWRKESLSELVEEFDGDEKEAKQEWLGQHPVRKDPAMRKEVEQMLRKHGLSEKDIDRWRFFLAEQSFFNRLKPRHKAGKKYLLAVDDNVLKKAEDTNYMIFILNQLLYVLRGEMRTVQNVIGHFLEPRCEQCHMPIEFNPRLRRAQYTCGKKECEDAHRNAKKRKNRQKVKQREAVNQRHT